MELNGFPPEQPALAMASSSPVRMPALAAGTAAHAHTVDSALVTLESLGVGAHRIQLRRFGRDARQPGSVMRQSPPPGTLLSPADRIQLEIAGLGFTQALPVGMWDSGGEAAVGTRELLEPLDDPLEKLKHWFHEGAPLFRLSPDDKDACERWLGLFGILAEDWPESLWYRLAASIANLPELTCSEEGCAFLLAVLLGLPVQGFCYRPVLAPIPSDDLSRLASRATRLGVDLLLGDRTEDVAETVIEVGPVTLTTYERFAETEAGASLLRRVLVLLMPMSASYDVRWIVGDPSSPPRLGMPERNARLGINSHMGTAMPVVQEAVLARTPALLDSIYTAMHGLGSGE